MTTFETLGLSAEVQSALAEMSFATPMPIQEKTIPLLLENKDVIGQAQTGTGKTAAFAIPIIEKVCAANDQVQAIVICPTRELALQVAEEFRKLAKHKSGLSTVCVYGGQPMDRQLLALQRQPQILVGTPGRMLDHLWRGSFHLEAVQTVVLDEADEMLNMGFREEIDKIFDFIPQQRQTVLFSATMPKPILALTKQYQQDPVWVRIVPEAQTTQQITQVYLEVPQKAKPKALTQLIEHYGLSYTLVFCNTKRQVDGVVQYLHQNGYDAEGLHGGKAQNQRERILRRFRKRSLPILVATDVAARGIDVRSIQAVINYDLPEETESYTHRIGRTGRAGQSGQAFSLVAGHQLVLLKQLQQNPENCLIRQTLAGIPTLQDRTPLAHPAAKRRRKHRRPSGNSSAALQNHYG